MPLFFIHTMNADLDTRDEGQDYAEASIALTAGISGAVALATDEIQRGALSSAVVVGVEREDGTPVLRSVVSLAVAPLLRDGSTQRDRG